MKKVLMIVTILMVFAVGASAQLPSKPFNIYIGGSIAMPSSPDGFKDGYNMGFFGNAGVGFNINPMFQAIAKVEYNYFKMDADEFVASNPLITAGTEITGGALKALMFGADVRFSPPIPAAPLKPFAFVGLGMARLSSSAVESPIDIPGVELGEPFESTSKMYMNAGLGVDIQSFFVHIRYLRVGSPYEAPYDDALVSIPVTIGMKF
jgi:hypothetical protein